MPVHTRSVASIAEDQLLVTELNDAEDNLEKFTDLTTIVKLLRYQINQNDALNVKVEKNSADIAMLMEENCSLRTKVQELEETTVTLEQYSRKDVLILTGLDMDPNERRTELAQRIAGIFNKICTTRTFAPDDFCAVHRNGHEYKNNRPPSVTVKFLRFTDKDLLFDKSVKILLRKHLPKVNYFHNLCRSLIDEQDKIRDHDNVKFVIYQGVGRNFSVCLNKPEGRFINKILNYNNFLKTLAKSKLC